MTIGSRASTSCGAVPSSPGLAFFFQIGAAAASLRSRAIQIRSSIWMISDLTWRAMFGDSRFKGRFLTCANSASIFLTLCFRDRVSRSISNHSPRSRTSSPIIRSPISAISRGHEAALVGGTLGIRECNTKGKTELEDRNVLQRDRTMDGDPKYWQRALCLRQPAR